MSRLRSYLVFPTRAEQFHEQANADEFYNSITAYFRQEYLPQTDTGQDRTERLWRVMRDKTVAYADRVVLALTFDRTLIPIAEIPLVAATLNCAIRKMERAHFKQGAKNLVGFSEVIQRRSAVRAASGCLGIGLSGQRGDVWLNWPANGFNPLSATKLVESRLEEDAIIKVVRPPHEALLGARHIPAEARV